MSYSYTERCAEINPLSVEYELARWLKDTASEIDCIEDADFGGVDINMPLVEHDWFVATQGGTEWIEDAEPVLYGISGDDLDYLTVHDGPPDIEHEMTAERQMLAVLIEEARVNQTANPELAALLGLDALC